MPLLVRGARQVGKTWTIRNWAQHTFGKENLLEINFEERPDFAEYFRKDLVVDRILDELGLSTNFDLKSGKVLIFFDEIQRCEPALSSLRYFFEKRPDIPVIAAGSLLEFVLEELSFPVGRVTSLFMYPVNFFEYLSALGKVSQRDFLQNYALDVTQNIPAPLHEELLIDLKRYYRIGGMPKALATYLNTESYSQVGDVHQDLLTGFRSDLPKYSKKSDWAALNAVFSGLVHVVGSTSAKYSKLAPDFRAEKVKSALYLLENAGLCCRVTGSFAQKPPLEAHSKASNFKLLHLDIGLLQHSLGFDWGQITPSHDLTDICNGIFAEQFVGQELLASIASRRGPLHYWERSEPHSSAEIDFLIEREGKIAPVEVKSGPKGRLKSLAMYEKNFSPETSFVISAQNASKLERTVFLPLYLAGHLRRGE